LISIHWIASRISRILIHGTGLSSTHIILMFQPNIITFLGSNSGQNQESNNTNNNSSNRGTSNNSSLGSRRQQKEVASGNISIGSKSGIRASSVKGITIRLEALNTTRFVHRARFGEKEASACNTTGIFTRSSIAEVGVDTARVGVARICSAVAAVVTVDGSEDTSIDSGRRIAGIRGTQVVIVTNNRNIVANSGTANIGARIGGTVVTIITVDGGGKASSSGSVARGRVARISRASDRGMNTAGGGITSVDGAKIVVITIDSSCLASSGSRK
jgi:hypothetical protein